MAVWRSCMMDDTHKHYLDHSKTLAFTLVRRVLELCLANQKYSEARHFHLNTLFHNLRLS